MCNSLTTVNTPLDSDIRPILQGEIVKIKPAALQTTPGHIVLQVTDARTPKIVEEVIVAAPDSHRSTILDAINTLDLAQALNRKDHSSTIKDAMSAAETARDQGLNLRKLTDNPAVEDIADLIVHLASNIKQFPD